MSDLEAPEVPIELSSSMQAAPEKKKGFFAKLFSKKSDDERIEAPSPSIGSMPSLDSNIPMPDFDVSEGNDMIMPSLEGETARAILADSGAKGNKSKGKIKKGHKSGKIKKIDESSQFDWTRDIEEQEILIHDSNRLNDDVGSDANKLIRHADDHAKNKLVNLGKNTLISEHDESRMKIDPMDIDVKHLEPLPALDMGHMEGFSGGNDLPAPMPAVDSETGEMFTKISSNHGKLRKKLSKVVNAKARPKKHEIAKLLNDYDESVEKHIEDKQMEFTTKKQSLARLEKHLKHKEKHLTNTHEEVKQLHGKLKDREDEMNEIIAETVDKELNRRLKQEREHLKNELKNTVKLNMDLKKKSKALDDDKVRMVKEHQKMMDSEQKKLTSMQSMYEKKLEQLTAEKKNLEAEKKALEVKRSEAMVLIKRAHEASKELDHINKVKEYVDNQKQRVDHELVEDRELKKAIDEAEKSLISEKKNLDNLIFSKYIENKLKSITPENLQERSDWKNELHSNPLYARITACRKMLEQKDIEGAKSAYNQIRNSYEQARVSRKEKEALYVAIRELYNDIQLKMVEAQMQPKTYG